MPISNCGVARAKEDEGLNPFDAVDLKQPDPDYGPILNDLNCIYRWCDTTGY